MDSLILQDFRCFAGFQEIPLRPLTLLVGENSSGKSRFVGVARIKEQLRSPLGVPPDFNEEPFALGAFDELANWKGGKAGRAETFRLGMTFHKEVGGNPLAIRFVAEFSRV